MKNLKAKLSSLLAIAMLATQLIVPSALAAGDDTAAEDTQWKTAYEQDFTEAGITDEYLKNDGWDMASYSVVDGAGLRLPDKSKQYTYTYLNKDFGTQYKITAVYTTAQGAYDTNGFDFIFAGVNLGISRSRKKITFGAGEYQKEIAGYTSYQVVLTRDGNDLTAQITNLGNNEDYGTYTATVPENATNMNFGFRSGDYGWEKMPTVKSVKVETPESYVAWKTLYNQDFMVAGLTNDELKGHGWDMASYSVVDGTGLMLKAGGDKYTYTTLKKDLGTQYKITTVFRDTIDSQPANGFDLKTAGLKLGIIRNEGKVTFGGTTTSQTIDGYSTYRVEFIREGSTVTAHVYNVTKSLDCGTYTATVPENATDMYFGFRSGYGWEAKPVVRSVKIEVPETFVPEKKYITEYTRNFTYTTDEAPYTEEEIKAEGWVYSVFMSPTKDGLKADTETSQHAYAWYNKNLGENYIADLSVQRNFYGSEQFYFNATVDANGNPLSGFAVRNGQDWGSDKIKLYKYVQVEKDGKTVSQETFLAESDLKLGGMNPLNIHIEYKNGKILVSETKSNESNKPFINYDATSDITANPELASGVIGGKSMYSKTFNNSTDYYVIRSLSIQKPEDGVQFGTLSANAVAGEEAVTASYSVKLNNNTDTKLNGKILAAAYNTNGQLVGVDILGGKYGSMGQQDISGTIICSEAPTSVKVFIFGDLTDIEPLATAATANLAE